MAEIVKCQPYSAYDIPEEADIWILSQLDIIDKHRLLVVANQKVAASEFVVTSPDGQRFHREIAEAKWKPMEDGTELIRFDLSSPVPGEVNVRVQLVATVQLDQTGLACDGVALQDALNQCLALVSAIVQEILASSFLANESLTENTLPPFLPSC